MTVDSWHLGILGMGASHQRATISSWATMWTVPLLLKAFSTWPRGGKQSLETIILLFAYKAGLSMAAFDIVSYRFSL